MNGVWIGVVGTLAGTILGFCLNVFRERRKKLLFVPEVDEKGRGCFRPVGAGPYDEILIPLRIANPNRQPLTICNFSVEGKKIEVTHRKTGGSDWKVEPIVINGWDIQRFQLKIPLPYQKTDKLVVQYFDLQNKKKTLGAFYPNPK